MGLQRFSGTKATIGRGYLKWPVIDLGIQCASAEAMAERYRRKWTVIAMGGTKLSRHLLLKLEGRGVQVFAQKTGRWGAPNQGHSAFLLSPKKPIGGSQLKCPGIAMEFNRSLQRKERKHKEIKEKEKKGIEAKRKKNRKRKKKKKKAKKIKRENCEIKENGKSKSYENPPLKCEVTIIRPIATKSNRTLPERTNSSIPQHMVPRVWPYAGWSGASPRAGAYSAVCTGCSFDSHF